MPNTDERGVSRPQGGTVDIGAVEAYDLVVTNLSDSPSTPGSLPYILAQTNADDFPGTDLIDFQPGLSGPMTVTSTLLINHDVWIRGPGAAQITFNGGGNTLIFGINTNYQTAGNFNNTIQGLTLTDGDGAIVGGTTSYGYDITTVANCVIEECTTGAIETTDNWVINDCQIINNNGNGVYIPTGGTVDMNNCYVAGNTSNGVGADNNVCFTNSTFANNDGDGTYMGDNNAALVNCTFTNNGGEGFAINFQDTAYVINSTIIYNKESDLHSIGGNAEIWNSIVGTPYTQGGFGTITSEGNNIFLDNVPQPAMSILSSDVVAPIISSLTANSGGSLAQAKYYYEVAAVTSSGTLTSEESSVNAGPNGEVTLNWSAPITTASVSEYEIFRGTTSGGEVKVGTTSATTFTDTGAAGSGAPLLLVGPLTNNGGPRRPWRSGRQRQPSTPSAPPTRPIPRIPTSAATPGSAVPTSAPTSTSRRRRSRPNRPARR